MLIDEEEDNSAEELLALAKVQKQLKGIKNSDDVSKNIMVAVSALSDAIEDMTEAHNKSEYYDKELGKSLSGALTKLSESLVELAKEQKIDVTPLVKSNEAIAKSNEKNLQSVASIMVNLQEQNNELIKSLTKTETKEIDLQPLVKAIISSNEAMREGMKEIDYTKVLSKISERPTQWRHEVYYTQNGKVDHIISKTGTK